MAQEPRVSIGHILHVYALRVRRDPDAARILWDVLRTSWHVLRTFWHAWLTLWHDRTTFVGLWRSSTDQGTVLS